MSYKIVSKGARLAIVAGIIIAIAAVATIVTLSASRGPLNPPLDGGDNSNTTKPRQIEVNLNENLTVKAK